MDEGIRKALIYHSNPLRPKEDRWKGIAPCMEILRGPFANEACHAFADALDDLSGYGIGRKTCAMIRAYIQNADMLANHGCSFRQYLDAKAPLPCAPVENVVAAEQTWIRAIERDFYNVGPALANYMVCDWLLGLWREGRVRWFEAYKSDSVFLRTLGESGKLPAEAVDDFVGYCRALRLQPEWLPAGLADRAGWPTTPRILNEAIWLNESAQSRWTK